MSNYFDFCILGAGLAGITLAYELLKKNTSVCLIDPNGVASGASGTPLGLVNPATGRYATMSWEAEKCYAKIKENLEVVQQQFPVLFFKETGVLRPALDEKIASKMKDNFVSQPWPDNWIEWKGENELNTFHPGINCSGGGVWLPIGLTVDTSTYLKSFSDFLLNKGLKTVFNEKYSISKKGNYWEFVFSESNAIKASNLVFATGTATLDSEFWKEMPIYPVKGQLAVLKFDSSFSLDHAVSALGYTTSLNKNQFVIGSTYEHSFDYKEPDKKGLQYLLERFRKVLPELDQNSKVLHQWAGIRASTPNRMPVLGTHPYHENLFVFAGLGSKGLLYSGYLSELMSDFLTKRKELPSEVHINRLNFKP